MSPARTAADIAGQVRADPTSAPRVVEECLDRIAALDPRLGAFQIVCADAARAEANDLARRDLAGLPLAGVPVAIKDNVDVQGLPTRYGSGATTTAPAEKDDELVRRLRDAGAVVVGKTKLPELAIWSFTESRAHGGTATPWDLSRNAGGSTGGGAAAVAAGLVPVALGSDGGGSLRIPAAFCGVVGYKPARAVVPLAGGAQEHWYGCSVFGAIASSVADVSAVTDVLAGRTVTSVTVPPRALRVAVSMRAPVPIARPDGVTRAGIGRAVELLTAAGHAATPADPPYPLTMANDWGRCWLAGIAEDVEVMGLDETRLEPRTLAMVRRGRRLRRRGRPTAEARTSWTRTADAWFGTFDVLVSPTVARAPARLGGMRDSGYWRSYLWGATTTPYTQAWNLTGYPAVTLPLPRADGAPYAVQLVAPPGREGLLLGLAAQLEEAAGRPGLPPIAGM